MDWCNKSLDLADRMSIYTTARGQGGQSTSGDEIKGTTSKTTVPGPRFLLSVADISRSMSGKLRPTPEPSTAAPGLLGRGSGQGRHPGDRHLRSPDAVSVTSAQGKGKKNVSFSPEKNLVQVFEISPRPDPPLLEELEPCDIDKLIQEQQLEGFRYVYGSFSLHKFRRVAENNNNNSRTNELPYVGNKHSSENGWNKNDRESTRGRRMSSTKSRSGGRIHIHQESSLNAFPGDKIPVKGILTNGNSNHATHNNTRCNQFSKGLQDTKFKSALARESRGPQFQSSGYSSRGFNVDSGNLLYTSSRNSNKSFHLNISGESITANSRVHPSPYRQSSASQARPFGALRVDSAMGLLSLSGHRPAPERDGAPGGRRVQSAGPHVSPRKVYAWRAADSAKRGRDSAPGGPCISQMWGLTPRARDVTEPPCS